MGLEDKRKTPILFGGCFLESKQNDKQVGYDSDWERPQRLVTANEILYSKFGGILIPDEEFEIFAEFAKLHTEEVGIFSTDHKQGALDVFGNIHHYELGKKHGQLFLSCMTTLFCGESEEARLARRLIETHTVQKTSAEILYDTAECSICHNVVKFGDTNGLCSCIRDHSFSYIGNQPVYEIIRGIMPVGSSLLRRPADKRAGFDPANLSTRTESGGIYFNAACFEMYQGTIQTEGDEMDKEELEAREKQLKEDEAALAAKIKAFEEGQTVDDNKTNEPEKPEKPEGGSVDLGEEDGTQGDGNNEGETGTNADDTTKTPREGMTGDEKDKVIADLTQKLEFKDQELILQKKVTDNYRQLYEVKKWEYRYLEAKVIVEAMDKAGHFKSDEDKDNYYWKLVYKTDSEIAGIKAVVLEFGEANGYCHMLGDVDKDKKQVSLLPHQSRQEAFTNNLGANPDDVGDRIGAAMFGEGKQGKQQKQQNADPFDALMINPDNKN